MTPARHPRPPARRAAAASLRVALGLALGAAAALLVACGGSGKGLISASQAGPLKSDIEAVTQAAERGNGDCTETEEALSKTDQDFAALPRTLNSALRSNLRQGIENLHRVALVLCSQPLARTNTTTTPKTATTPPATTTTPTTTTPTTPSTTTAPPAKKEPQETPESPGVGGGTPAPGEGSGAPPGAGAGGAGPEENGGNEAGGAEGAK